MIELSNDVPFVLGFTLKGSLILENKETEI